MVGRGRINAKLRRLCDEQAESSEGRGRTTWFHCQSVQEMTWDFRNRSYLLGETEYRVASPLPDTHRCTGSSMRIV